MKLLSLFLLYALLSLNSAQLQSINLISCFIQWQNLGNETFFKLTTNFGGLVNASNAWLGIGFNNNPEFKGANIIVCRHGANESSVQHFINSGLYSELISPEDPLIGLTSRQIELDDTNLTCTFVRANSIDMKNYLKIDETTNFYLLVSYGSGSFETYVKDAISQSMVSFRSSSDQTNTFNNFIFNLIWNFLKTIFRLLFGF